MTPPAEEPEEETPPAPVVRPLTIDISRNQNGGAGFTTAQFGAFRDAGVGQVVVKLLGANNPDYPLYTELVHQDPARAAGLELGHYIANGQVGTSAAIAKAVRATGQVRAGETLWLDVEDWPEDGVRRWTPAECEAVATALRDEFKPLDEQGIYLNLSLANSGGYREMMDRLGGLQLWLAAYTGAPTVLLRGGWTRKPTLWQYTSDSLPSLRAIYDAGLDVNRDGSAVWLVSDLQAALNKVGGYGLAVDNDEGPKTVGAVSDYQSKRNLVVDGDAGPKTLTRLVAEVA